MFPDLVRAELERLDGRWRQLPLDQALRALPSMQEFVQHLADEVAEASGMPCAPVPDLGPAVVVDQLRVMVFDMLRAGRAEGLADRLATLRRQLS
jgi:hypothetical protein